MNFQLVCVLCIGLSTSLSQGKTIIRSHSAKWVYAGIDLTFIEKVEGFTTYGYVPQDSSGCPLGHSGVTIADGVDFGSRTEQSLRDMGVPDDVVKILAPYCGLMMYDAIEYLEAHPLTLTEGQARYLEARVAFDHAKTVATVYDKSVNSTGNKTLLPFDGLTLEQRTVVFSVLYQYGSYTRVPHFWEASVSQLWWDVVYILRHFHDNYATRRNEEADYLQDSLPPNATRANY